ncbi:adenosylcobyric acid synthase (glutamine-hydrolysing) [Thalassoporum mexicanum PCC 7367]|nr:adenosylcobyric acid synthase (glutamine-hydrolysing) [Pseudanabaena sp. PCC 7367]
MVVGTASNAGKSLLCAAFCRLLKQKGYNVTPFKGQNMALNSYVVENNLNGSGEIGYAQAVQAWAAQVKPTVAMNPILLKPQGDMTSQVIHLGKPVGITKAANYYRNYFDSGWQCIQASLAKLAADFEVVVCEGAGSPAEVNLRHRDLTNMRVALHLKAQTILVVNIDLGGAFAHVVGTLQLLPPEERALIKGIIINKFRGQRSLLDSGVEWLEKYTGISVLGVIPYLDIAFPAEDSASLFERRSRLNPAELQIVVIRLPRISNFTDFDPLLAEPSIDLKYILPGQSLGQPDAVILPGSKTTIADLEVLRSTGMIDQLRQFVNNGGVIMGICGGLQMLGKSIVDPECLEGDLNSAIGLNLLPIETVITPIKTAQQRSTTTNLAPPNLPITGYEIHQGKSNFSPLENEQVMPWFADPNLGFVTSDRQVWATYLHGIFDNGKWRRSWLNLLREKKNLPPLTIEVPDYNEQRDQLLDDLAKAIAEHVDLGRLGF